MAVIYGRDLKGRFVPKVLADAEAQMLIEAEQNQPAWLRKLIYMIANEFGITPDEFESRVNVVHPAQKERMKIKIRRRYYYDPNKKVLTGVGELLQEGYCMFPEDYILKMGLKMTKTLPGRCEIEGEVEGVPAPVFASIIIARVELLFLLLQEQAQRGIKTHQTEGKMQSCKEMFTKLSEHPDGFVFPLEPVPITENTKLNTLLSVQVNTKHVINNIPAIPLTGIYHMWGALCIVVPPRTVEFPELAVKWTGKEFVCLHQENMI